MRSIGSKTVLIFQGWAYVALARAIRSTFDGVHPRPAA